MTGYHVGDQTQASRPPLGIIAEYYRQFLVISLVEES